MSANSKIEWTEATWNPTVGCSIVSPGCTNCYAMKVANGLERRFDSPKYRGLTKLVNGNAVWTGEVRLDEIALLQPLKWKRGRRIFVNSMSDLFHESLPDTAIDKVFAVMALRPQHTFQVLTKRAERMRAYCSDPQTPFRVARSMDELAARRDVGLEEIRPIAEYPGYFASSHGFIYSERRGKRRRMSPDIGDQGHTRVQLYRGTSPKTADRLLVHRLILETFVGPPPSENSQGRHRDQVPTNNAVSNLLWGDQSANWDDAKRHGSHRRYSKLTEVQAGEVRSRHAAGETGEALAREFDVSATQIRNIASGKQWAVAAPIEWPLRNVWKGVSCERQQEADERIPLLLQTPAAVRFISAEPLVGPIDLRNVAFPDDRCDRKIDAVSGEITRSMPGVMRSRWHARVNLDWIIVGGESGSKARPMHPQWARDLRDQCAAAGVSFFFKQWGEHIAETVPGTNVDLRYDLKPNQSVTWGDGKTNHTRYTRVGKKAAGRLLDGRTHDEFPQVRA